jgi:hypothetical protein
MKARITIRTVILALLLAAASAAQPGDEEALSHKLDGRDLPRYHLLPGFFAGVHSDCVIVPQLCDDLLESIGFDEKSAEVLMKAVVRYRELEFGEHGPRVYSDKEAGQTVEMGRGNRGPDPRGFATEEEYMQALAELEDEKARRLADIYAELQRDAAELGVSLTGIEQYFQQRLAPQSSATSNKPFDAASALWRTSAAFEERFEERVRELSHQ